MYRAGPEERLRGEKARNRSQKGTYAGGNGAGQKCARSETTENPEKRPEGEGKEGKGSPEGSGGKREMRKKLLITNTV